MEHMSALGYSEKYMNGFEVGIGDFGRQMEE